MRSLLRSTSVEAQVNAPLGMASVGISVDLEDLFGNNPSKAELRETIDTLFNNYKQLKKEVNGLRKEVGRLEREIDRLRTRSDIGSSESAPIFPAEESDVDVMTSIAKTNPTGFSCFFSETSELTNRLSCDAGVISFPDRSFKHYVCQHPGCTKSIIAGEYCAEHFLQSGTGSDLSDSNTEQPQIGKTRFSHEPNVGVWTLDENRIDYNPLTDRLDFVERKSSFPTHDEETYTFSSTLDSDLTLSENEAHTVDNSRFQLTCGEDECTREVDPGEEYCTIHRFDLSRITSESRDYYTEENKLDNNKSGLNVCNFSDCDKTVFGSRDYCSEHTLPSSDDKKISQDFGSALSITRADICIESNICLKSGCDRSVLGSDVYCKEHSSTTSKIPADPVPVYSTVTDCAQPGCSNKVDTPGHYCREHSY